MFRFLIAASAALTLAACEPPRQPPKARPPKPPSEAHIAMWEQCKQAAEPQLDPSVVWEFAPAGTAIWHSNHGAYRASSEARSAFSNEPFDCLWSEGSVIVSMKNGRYKPPATADPDLLEKVAVSAHSQKDIEEVSRIKNALELHHPKSKEFATVARLYDNLRENERIAAEQGKIAAKQEEAQLEKARAAARERERATASLDVKSFSWSKSRSANFAIVEGMVKNVTAHRLENIQAVAIFTDKDGSFITSDTAMVEYNPIMPGQSSPYKVMARYNPAMNSCRVEFKMLGVGTLPVWHSWRK